MTGKEKLYFLLNRIDDARVIAPSGQPLIIDPTNDLNKKYRGVELDQLFTKLEKDEKVLKVLQTPNRVKNAIFQVSGQYRNMDDGCYHLRLLPAFDGYFLNIQNEPEYQEFSGRKPAYKPSQETEPENLAESKKPMVVSADIVSYDLQAMYSEIQNEKNDGRFYLKVANYGKYLNNNDALDPLVNQLRNASQIQVATFKKTWRKFFEEWYISAKDLIETVNTVGVKDEGPLQNEVAEVKIFLNQPDPQFNHDDPPRYYYPYREIILRFIKLGKGHVLTKRHLDKNGNIKLYSEFSNVETEWDKFKAIREISVWWAHYQISRLAGGALGSKEEKNQYFDNNNEVDQLYKYEFGRVSHGDTTTLVILNRHKFEEWITRLHNHIIPRLRELIKREEPSLKQKHNQPLEKIKTDIAIERGRGQVECCGLIYSFRTSQLIYSSGKKDVSPEGREMRFFLTLYRHKGQTVEYKTIAKETNLPSYVGLSENGKVPHEELKNKDFAEDASLLRRDFRTLVLSLGMSPDDFSEMIKTIPKTGYKLACG